MTTNFYPGYLDSLTFDQLRVTLDDMQVRYSLRKDASREYLLQVLKRHLDKTNNNASLNHTKSLESIQEEIMKEVFPQPEPRDLDYLKEIRQGSSSTKQSQQGGSNYQTPRQIRYPSIQGSAFSSSSMVRLVNGTPVEEKFSYSRENIYDTIQKSRQEDTNLLSAPHDGLYNDNISQVSHVESQKSMRGSREVASLRKPDPLRQSMNKSFDVNSSFFDEMFEDNRNCYSESFVLKGPVAIRHPELQRYKEDSTQESIRYRPNEQASPQSEMPSEARNSKRESFGSAQKVKMMTDEAIQEAQEGSKKRTIMILVVILVLALGALGARMFIPKMFYDKRTPVIYSESEGIEQDFGIHNIDAIKSGFIIQDEVNDEKMIGN